MRAIDRDGYKAVAMSALRRDERWVGASVAVQGAASGSSRWNADRP